MHRRSFVTGSGAFIALVSVGFGKGYAAVTKKENFPPAPQWKPSFRQPTGKIIERISYYLDGKRDFSVFRNGTCVVLKQGLSDKDAKSFSLTTLSNIFNSHPDMNPLSMDDGNILVRYNQPAMNVVLRDVARAHWPEIEKHHLEGLAASEVLITPQGPNKFDDFGKQALLGRAYMFMDAAAPEIIEIHRAN
ncbi:hypothetical protein [Rhizobium lusitanum]|uniref:Uncharacterized protein n=1 Tax=Rhizobium lusitanum TaxID=293958 RepID=A0A1C3UUZ8_9HYPH|nr:hypothetical protein [Rhizobium lusitanum]SCB19117.1 hypothetical protein GA0061101_103360 [Rhizobium lusitanum]